MSSMLVGAFYLNSEPGSSTKDRNYYFDSNGKMQDWTYPVASMIHVLALVVIIKELTLKGIRVIMSLVLLLEQFTGHKKMQVWDSLLNKRPM